MSRAFVKDEGPEPPDDPPERPVSDAPITSPGAAHERWTVTAISRAT